MATAMQTAERPSPLNVSERKIGDILRYGKNTKEEDDRLLVLLEVCCSEQEERDEKKIRDEGRWASEWCFGTFVTLRAQWCIEQYALVPAGKYPKSRKFLAKHIVDGLLGTRGEKDREQFAELLCTWPAEDGKIPADALREVTDFRWTGESYEKEKVPVLAELFTCFTRLKPLNEEVLRAVTKLVGIWVPVPDMILLGQCLLILQGPMKQPFLDFVHNAVAR